MTEQQFLDECERVFAAIEDGLDGADADVDTERSGPVLTLEFEDRTKIIINGNAPVRELWIAARTGGFHFRLNTGRWLDTRSGEDFYATLSKLISQQSGKPVVLLG